MVSNLDVSLYIPAYNAEKYLRKALNAVMELDPAPAEILIVDDGSSDRTVEVASEFPVRIVSHDGNKGLAAARNTGVTNSTCDLVASLDSDCVPRPDWLGSLLDCMNRPEIAGVGGKLVELNFTRLADKWRTLHMIQHRGDEIIDGSDFLFGHSTLFRKSALKKVGLYNERLRTNNEDEYISSRLLQSGFTLVYQPEAIVFHLREDTITSLLNTYWKWWFFGYTRDITLPNTLRSVVKSLFEDLPKLLAEDRRSMSPRLALVSVCAVGFACWKDFEYYVGHRGSTKMHDPAP